jgi:hypothetical protein
MKSSLMNTRRKPQEHSDINVVLHMPPESVYYLLRNAVHATNNKTIEFASVTGFYLCAMLFILGGMILPVISLQVVVMISTIGFFTSSALITVGTYNQLPDDFYFWMSDLVASNPPVIHSQKQKIKRPTHLQHDSITVNTPLEACIDLLMHCTNSGQSFVVDVTHMSILT